MTQPPYGQEYPNSQPGAGYPQQNYSQPGAGYPQQGYGQQGYGQPAPGVQPQTHQGAYGQPGAAPYGYDPATGLPYSDKSKLAAGLLGIFLGGLGVGRFYTGHVGLGVAQLVVSLVTLGAGSLWGFIDGIIMLAGSPTDVYGRPLRS